MGVYYWLNPATKLVEGIDESGRVITAQKTLDAPFDSKSPNGFIERVRPNGETYWTQEGVDEAVSNWTYSPMVAGAIASEIASGGLITTLHKKHSWCPPYAILSRWMTMYPEFKEAIDAATEHRATVHFEEIMTVADEAYREARGTDDQVAAAKMKIDAMKFLSEKGDKRKYGREKSEGDTNVQIVISTGITREPKDVTPPKAEIGDIK